MRIEALDAYYLAMPEILDIGDGSQDALLIRVQAGGHVGWGECDASPLTSIASLVCPMSHGACKPVRDSVLGQRLDSIDDIGRIGNLVRENSLDVLQADHTLSGIDIALWDLMGKRFNEPVYRLLGYPRACPKTPYASVLFGDNPQETLIKARRIRAQGYVAAKFGWGTYGQGSVAEDAEQVQAAREGLEEETMLLVDAGTVWIDDLDAASRRIESLERVHATWLEEPFISGEVDAYKRLASMCQTVKLAGGEGSHNFHIARQMIERAGIGYVQIDAGRIGGISVAKRVADLANSQGITYVNHTFTTHLALSASLQPFAGLESHTICEYPAEAKPVSAELTLERILPDANGQIHLPGRPGLGMTPDPTILAKYLVDVEIRTEGRLLYRSPPI